MTPTEQIDRQSQCNRWLSDTLREFISAFPDTPLTALENACCDLRADADAIFAQVQSARAEADAVPDDMADDFIRRLGADLRPYRANLPASLLDALNPGGGL
ncbi:hypothetical protein K7H20_13940 [Salipiger manganoxidans]|uniref:hypothetical protein n=1 Tax=Salipiger marinus TaxID=555512 RepID=UPI001E390A1F|nr:hypothetical protein [Salipiger manganoxidans]MCD1619167.1 hypothetical protein [Salipiger manganoxidans]